MPKKKKEIRFPDMTQDQLDLLANRMLSEAIKYTDEIGVGSLSVGSRTKGGWNLYSAVFEAVGTEWKRARGETHEHKISVRASNNWRPVVEYEFYCRDCGDTIEKVFTLEQIPPDVRRSQLILTAAKYVGIEKATEWGRAQKLDEFYRTDFAQVIKQAMPQPDCRCGFCGSKVGITLLEVKKMRGEFINFKCPNCKRQLKMKQDGKGIVQYPVYESEEKPIKYPTKPE